MNQLLTIDVVPKEMLISVILEGFSKQIMCYLSAIPLWCY